MTLPFSLFRKTLPDVCGGERDGSHNMHGGEGEGPCDTCGIDEQHGEDER
jgi:hypothetical protein